MKKIQTKKDTLFISYFILMVFTSLVYKYKLPISFIISKIAILLALITVGLSLGGCGSKVIVETVEIKKEISIISIKNMEKLDNVDTIVQNDSIVLTTDNFKKIIMNYKRMDDYNSYLLDVIKYYEYEIKK